MGSYANKVLSILLCWVLHTMTTS